MRWILPLSLVVLIVSIILGRAMNEVGLIYFPDANYAVTPADFDLDAENIQLKTDDGIQVSGWWLPAREKLNSTYTILHLHGNAGNISHRLDIAQALNRSGWNLFLLDYRGYGRSEGKPSEKGFYLDAQAAYDYLVQEKQVLPQQLVLFGESIGCSVAIELACHHTAWAMILQTPMTSITDMARHHYPWLLPLRALIKSRFDVLPKVEQLKIPTLIIHGTEDEIVPFEHGKKVFEYYAGPKYFYEVPGAMHNDLFYRAGDKIMQRIQQFIDEISNNT